MKYFLRQLPGLLLMIILVYVFVTLVDLYQEHRNSLVPEAVSALTAFNPHNNKMAESDATDPAITRVCDKDCIQFVAAAFDKCGGNPLTIESSSALRIDMNTKQGDKLNKIIYNMSAVCANKELIRHEWTVYEHVTNE